MIHDYFGRNMSGGYSARISHQKVGQWSNESERAGFGDINSVFVTITDHTKVNSTNHMTRVDLAIDYLAQFENLDTLMLPAARTERNQGRVVDSASKNEPRLIIA